MLLHVLPRKLEGLEEVVDDLVLTRGEHGVPWDGGEHGVLGMGVNTEYL